jgi:NAD(P)-dependent dehydrogenase (short-subunit alcohol dehydrogenase family)
LGSGGSIVFLSSLGAHAAVGALSAYAATKGAIDTLVNWPRRLGIADLKRAAAARRMLIQAINVACRPSGRFDVNGYGIAAR